jgi:hypothetical protein
MYLAQLHTRQYSSAERHTLRAIAAMVGVGLAALSGSGIARADTSHEQQACALMDDHGTAISRGYSATPVQYALAVLSTEVPESEAGHVIAAATRDYCPNHAADLPAGWQ